MALAICCSCDSFYNEQLDKCDKCNKTIPEQITDFRKQSLLEVSQNIKQMYWKGYNKGVRTVNERIILF